MGLVNMSTLNSRTASCKKTEGLELAEKAWRYRT